LEKLVQELARGVVAVQSPVEPDILAAAGLARAAAQLLPLEAVLVLLLALSGVRALPRAVTKAVAALLGVMVEMVALVLLQILAVAVAVAVA
jgi:hypothetical protein